MSDRTRGPNMYDVAKLAQVSHQTVSRVVNNHPNTREETRERVLRAMEELGYRPNQAARALASSRSRIIGILVSDADLFGPAGMTRAIENVAQSINHFAVSCSIDPDSEDSVIDGINHLKGLGVDGLVMITPRTDAVTLARTQLGNIPIVTVDSMYRVDELSVSIDNFQGGQLATEHLIELGHRSILHIAGPPSWFEATARASGYAAAMRSHRLTPRIIEGDWTPGSGYEIGVTLDLEAYETTGIFAGNDDLALGLLHAFDDRGIDVPGDVSIIGYDDIPHAAYWNPPLTTMQQDFYELGERAMRLLIDTIERRKLPAAETLVPRLIQRSSTAAPRRNED
ncbi:MAG: LacI family DNA-binding transcriptional regulator [Pontimonas sp.]